MPRQVLVPLLLLIICASAPAAQVAFLEVIEDGKTVQLEPGGQFFHVAIRYKDKWLHAHTYHGVSLVESLDRYGDNAVVLTNSNVPDPSDELVAKLLGRKFDFSFRWNDPESTYCTKLVAEILGVPPRPMTFAAPIWQTLPHGNSGELGLSPDELFHDLVNRGYTVLPDCETPLVE
jgi:hypothetical protein